MSSPENRSEPANSPVNQGSQTDPGDGYLTLQGTWGPEATQAEAEHLMLKLGEQRQRKKLNTAKEKARETVTRSGARLLRDLGQPLAEAIKDWLKKAKTQPGPRHKALEYIQRIQPELLAVFTLKVVLDAMSRDRSFVQTAKDIGNRCEDEDRYTLWAKEYPDHFNRVKRNTRNASTYQRQRRLILTQMVEFGLDAPRWPRDCKQSVGIVLLQLCADHTGLIEVYHTRRGKKTELRICPTDEALKWAEDVDNRGTLIAPMTLPFLEKPLDWVSPLSGGYHSTDIFRSCIVKANSNEYVRELERAHMPQVYQAVNHLQNTAWQVNSEVFQVFSYIWEQGHEVAGLPSREHQEIPPKPADIDTNKEARREWAAQAAATHNRNHQRTSDRLSTAKTHWVAERYERLPFWFCYQLDWRGRAYPVGYFLHPQGPDLCKGLLEFHQAKPVVTDEAKLWHKIHGANCWGMDKEPFPERIQWVEDNQDMILRVSQDPLEHTEWQEADDPWQFLAWCLDFGKLQDDPNHLSRLPIHQDATQSGIQIYSMLLRDRKAAEMTNVTPGDRPQDLYQCVTDLVISRLKSEDRSQTHQELAQGWLRFGLDRSLSKRPVMTRVYNATRHSARIYTQDWADAKAKKTGTKYPSSRNDESTLWFLTMHLWEAMSEVIASTKRGQDWLTSLARVFSDQNKSIWWTNPLGFPIRQWYPKWLTRNLKTRIGEKFRQTTMIEELPKALRRKMLAGFAPNFIHSLDAAAMMLTVAKCKDKGVESMSCVHDSFATHACDADTLAIATREAYAEIFSDDLMENLRIELQQQVPDVILPEVPEYGDLDPQEVLGSPYFFS